MTFKQLTYQMGELTAKEVQQIAQQEWINVKNSDVLKKDLELNEADLKQIENINAAPYAVTVSGQGLTPEETLIIVSINVGSTLTYDVLCYIWRNYILSKVKKRGVDAIGPEKE